MKFFVPSLFIASILSSAAIADETLAHCSAKKTQQMELTQRMRAGTPAKTSHRKKGHSTRTTNTRQRIDDIDEWLWKNCRNYSEEMRTIEQQYM